MQYVTSYLYKHCIYYLFSASKVYINLLLLSVESSTVETTAMPPKKTSTLPVRVECEECGLSLLKSNLNRHMMNHNPLRKGSSSSSSMPLLCRSMSVDAARHCIESSISVPDRGMRRDVCLSDIQPSGNSGKHGPTSQLSMEQYLIANAAAAAVSEQHQIYDMQGLCGFITRHFPSIPVEVRPYLVVGAAAGAQHAAQIHFLAETHRLSQEPYKREIARSARCSLSNWAMGLRSEMCFQYDEKLQGVATRSNHESTATVAATQPCNLQEPFAFDLDLFPVPRSTSDLTFRQAMDDIQQDIGWQEVQAVVLQSDRNISTDIRLPETATHDVTDAEMIERAADEVSTDQIPAESAHFDRDNSQQLIVSIPSAEHRTVDKSCPVEDVMEADRLNEREPTVSRHDQLPTGPDATLPSVITVMENEGCELPISVMTPGVPAIDSEGQRELIVDLASPTLDADVFAAHQHRVKPSSTKTKDDARSRQPTVSATMKSAAPADSKKKGVSEEPTRVPMAKGERKQRPSTAPCRSTEERSVTSVLHSRESRRQAEEQSDRRRRSRSPLDRRNEGRHSLTEQEFRDFQRWKRLHHK